MTTSSEFVEVRAVRVALFYDYMPSAYKSQFDIYNPVQLDGKVRFSNGDKKQEAAFRQLASKVKQACAPKVFLFSVPYNDQSGTLNYILYETYIGALSKSDLDLDLGCIQRLAATLKEEKPEGLAFRMIDGEEVKTFMLSNGMWGDIIKIPENDKGRPRWFVFPEYGGIRQPGNLLPLTSYKLKGKRVAWWKSDERVHIRFDSESKWVQENDERHGVPVFTYGKKSYEEAAHTVCIDNASDADDDLVTAFGNLRFLATARTVPTSAVLETVEKEAPAARASSKKRVRSSSDGFDMAFMSRIVHKLTLDRLHNDDDEKLKTESNVTLALPQQYLSIENDISKRVFEVAKVRLQKGLPTYILVPVLNKSSWVVAGLYISSTQALRLHGNPIWTMDDDKNSGVVDTLYTTFTTIMPAFGGTVPPLKREVVDFSCSMYFVPKDSQASTGTSVVAMLMSQIGLLTADGRGYANLPFACDYCEKKSERLKSKLDAFAANAPDLPPPANNDGDDHDDRHDGGGDDLDGGDDGGGDGDDDDRDGKQSPVKKRAATSGTGMVREAAPDDAGGVGFSSRNIGLTNPNLVTCYMNAVLIGLFKILPIQTFLRGLNNAVTEPGHNDIQKAIAKFGSSKQLVNDHQGNEGLSSEEKNVVVACMWFRACDAVFRQYDSDDTGPPVATIPLVNAFRTLQWYTQMRKGQQDAGEFAKLCIQHLIPASLAWSRQNHVISAEAAEAVVKAYTAQIRTELTFPVHKKQGVGRYCKNGGSDETVPTSTLDVHLERNAVGSYLGLSDQIQRSLFDESEVEQPCEVCYPNREERKKDVQRFTCTKRTDTTYLPEYLIVNLTRTAPDRSKITAAVLPDDDGDVRISDTYHGGIVKYEIVCCIKHVGNGTQRGHYYALTTKETPRGMERGMDQAVLFDDEQVTDITKDDANSILRTGYVYILKRVDGALFGGAGGPANGAGVGAGAAVGFDGGRGRGRQRLSRLHRYASLD